MDQHEDLTDLSLLDIFTEEEISVEEYHFSLLLQKMQHFIFKEHLQKWT